MKSTSTGASLSPSYDDRILRGIREREDRVRAFKNRMRHAAVQEAFAGCPRGHEDEDDCACDALVRNLKQDEKILRSSIKKRCEDWFASEVEQGPFEPRKDLVPVKGILKDPPQ